MPTGQAERLMPALRRAVLGRQSAARPDGELVGAFVSTNDAEAFAELVRRHGPMVLGVCRRVTGDRCVADDAFQATFLVLARRASAVRPREQVGNFLYGVAYRTALKARTVLARRRARERQVSVMPEPIAPAAAAWTDLTPIIDEELDRLPDKLRLPVVLCDLEGRPQREVARHLNIPPATLATRLASARRALAARLTRRGVTLSGGALAGLLGVHASAVAVPSGLASGLVRAVEAGAAGAPLGSLVSANAVQLSEGVLRMMVLAKLKAVAVLAVTAVALTTGLGLGLVPAAADDAPKAGAPETPKTVKIAPASGGAAARGEAPAPADDATFLRRLTLDVRGTPPTDVELWFFVSDGDGDKRAKVVDWLTADDAAKLAVAKKLGVSADRIKLVRGKVSADGQFVDVKLEGGTERVVKPIAVDPVSAAFSPDGRKIAVESKWIGDYTGAVTGRLQAAKADPNKTAVAVWGEYISVGDKPRQAGVIGEQNGLWAFADADKTTSVVSDAFVVWHVIDSDAEFLNRVLTDVRGSGPTALETKYFTEDKDPKKRERLIDTLLKDAAVQKKLGDAWKAKMLAPAAATFKTTEVKGERVFITLSPGGKTQDVLLPKVVTPGFPIQPPVVVRPLPPVPPQPPAPPVVAVRPLPAPAKTVEVTAAAQADKFEKLVDALIAAKKDDAAILESVTLATLGRLPTDTEKKLASGVGKTTDRKAAWVAVARSLAGADEKPTPVKVKLIGAPLPPPPPLPPARP